jgi:hypothetical protein
MGQVIATEASAGNHRGEPSIGNRSADRAKHAQCEEPSSASDAWLIMMLNGRKPKTAGNVSTIMIHLTSRTPSMT